MCCEVEDGLPLTHEGNTIRFELISFVSPYESKAIVMKGFFFNLTCFCRKLITHPPATSGRATTSVLNRGPVQPDIGDHVFHTVMRTDVGNNHRLEMQGSA